MSDKTFWIWLLLFAIGIAGCEKPMPENQSATVTGEKSAQTVNVPPRNSTSILPGQKGSPGVLRTPDMPSYNWPADFKLPLVINMEAPQTPEEIQNPSPPIEEEKQAIEEEKKAIGEDEKPIEDGRE